jgi:hypothetical protein
MYYPHLLVKVERYGALCGRILLLVDKLTAYQKAFDDKFVNCLLAVLVLPQVQRRAMCLASGLPNLLDGLPHICLFFGAGVRS